MFFNIQHYQAIYYKNTILSIALPSNILQEYHYIDSTTKHNLNTYSSTGQYLYISITTGQYTYTTAFTPTALPGNIPTALPLYTEHYRAIYLQQYLYVYSSTAPYLHICSTSGQILAALQQYRAISTLHYLYM